jgi:cell division transport system permease protein
MTWWQAILYFLKEALTSIRRSPQVSVLAVVTIAVSVSMAGVMRIVSRNARETVATWRSQARFVVFLTDESYFESVAVELLATPWVRKLERVPRQEARERFSRAFASLAELLGPGHLETLPPSLELELDEPRVEKDRLSFEKWVERVRSVPGVETIDDDQDWIAQVERILSFVRGIGWLLTVLLLGASVFTIGSVVRFTAILYREEIEIMRLIGATEFAIRGPFYFEGMLQGLGGSVLAVLSLGAIRLLLSDTIAQSALFSALASRFLSLGDVALLVISGSLAGLIGAVLSLDRNAFPETS